MAYNPGATPVISSIEYSVAATGDTWFQPTISTSDSPDYTAAKAEAATQCAVMSPLGVEKVASVAAPHATRAARGHVSAPCL